MRSAERCTRRSLLDGSLHLSSMVGAAAERYRTVTEIHTSPHGVGMNSSVLSYLITSGTGADNG